LRRALRRVYFLLPTSTAYTAVRIAMAKEAFRIAGRVADAEGKLVADPVLEIWHRDWRPPPHWC
jgi:protocatechuate 3,4-dioxygenase beta subunit